MNNKNEMIIKLDKRMIEEILAGESFEYEDETRKGESFKIILVFKDIQK